jgi:hypothetical protein
MAGKVFWYGAGMMFAGVMVANGLVLSAPLLLAGGGFFVGLSVIVWWVGTWTTCASGD